VGFRGKAEIELTMARSRTSEPRRVLRQWRYPDEAAVRGAITSGWSNGQAEGQITRLKLVKRQICGRGKIDLLQTRLIGVE
jgi:transposase